MSTSRAIRWCFSVAAVLLFVATDHVSAALQATADVFTTQTSAPFTYNVALHNTGTTDIGTFWFAWTATPANYDFLPTSPSGIVSPTGWVAPVSHNGFPGDGYGIEWYNIAGSNIAAGQTVSTFQFTSNESPAILSGNAFFPGFKVTSSFVYTGFPLSDPGFLFVVNVPEPSTLVVCGIGAAMLVRRRRTSR